MLLATEDYVQLKRYTSVLAAALGERDLPTKLHAERVVDLAEALGHHQRLPDEQMRLLHLAASFHDVGKIGIPDRVLLKNGHLDQDEWRVMRQHTVIGERILRATGLTGSVQVGHVVRSHHEHFDGSGYPDKLAGEAIPLISRIISLADSYDAMAMVRPYQEPRTHAEIVEVMQTEAGTKHDPELLESFLAMLASHPLRVE